MSVAAAQEETGLAPPRRCRSSEVKHVRVCNPASVACRAAAPAAAGRDTGRRGGVARTGSESWLRPGHVECQPSLGVGPVTQTLGESTRDDAGGTQGTRN